MDKKKSKSRVGYGKPPHETQFKPGQSGNPGGRPKMKAITLIEALERELHTRVTANEGGRPILLSKLHVIAKQLTNKAISGDPKAIGALFKALESRHFEPKDSLSPVLVAMRAIYAKHETANHNVTTDTLSSGSDDKLENDGGEQQ